ncbi:MAG: phospho-N-acetylmuramoyl-pentapeptide-transferase, partial [Lachnospiraceae bacterium]|nr:phospho-N-acetylmuramoyl-pentapeptide-transferase [Lachnospiraceae bacterium]
MYNVLIDYLTPNQIAIIGILFGFVLTFLGLKYPFGFLPVDQGREFAVNGALSRGKTRGVGLTFVSVFVIASLLFMPVDIEYVIYC